MKNNLKNNFFLKILVHHKQKRTLLQVVDLVEDSLKSAVSYAGGKDLSALKTVDFIDLRN